MIFITGIAGFIGSSTAKKLNKDGVEVIGIDNFNDYYDPEIKRKRASELEKLGIKVYEDDLRNDINYIFKENNIDAILHIAASAGVRYSIQNPAEVIENNVYVTQKLLEMARVNKINNFVFASSSSVYGNTIKDTEESLKEDSVLKNIYSPYAASKLSCEKINDVYTNLYKMNIISIRYFTVFGPDQRPDLAIIKFIDGIHNEKPIDKYGEGKTFRDYTYIDDIVDINIKSLMYNKANHGKHHIMNACSNNPINLNKLINLIERVVDKKAIVNQMGMQLGDVFGTYGNNAKALEILDWSPKTDVSDGLMKTFEWYKNK